MVLDHMISAEQYLPRRAEAGCRLYLPAIIIGTIYIQVKSSYNGRGSVESNSVSRRVETDTKTIIPISTYIVVATSICRLAFPCGHLQSSDISCDRF